MAEDRYPPLQARSLLDRLSDHGAYPSQLSRIGALLVHRLANLPAVRELGAFGNADDAEAPTARGALLDDAKRGVPGKNYLRQ
jgi:hypothetical protein